MQDNFEEEEDYSSDDDELIESADDMDEFYLYDIEIPHDDDF